MKTRASWFAFLLLATSLFGAGRQLTGPYAPTPTPALPAEEAQKKFVVPDGFQARLFAAEPDVVNPVAMTWDERGRLWVLELYEYPLGAPPGAKPRDRIKILEDTDNDGRADKATLFADGLNLATGLLLGNGGAYVGQAPHLLFLQDTNGDDVADTRTILLTGFGLEDRHELLNGFTWGPDGQLYMTHGVFTRSKVKIPEATEPGVLMTAAVARFHPRTKKFEVFAEGTSNPWGVDFDRAGNAFVSACVIDHLFHISPGGSYQRQAGTPPNPFAYEILPSIVEHKHHMAAYCGVCVYQGDQFPAEYHGHVLMGNIHQSAVNHDRLTPNGSSFKATAEKDFLTTSDGWFRPISIQVGPDGALWVGDWYDKYPCYQNAQADPDGVDRQHGRIWRVVYTGKSSGKKIPSRPDTKMDLGKLTTKKLVALLEHPNVWQRRMAQRLLCERRDGAARPALLDLLEKGKTLESRLAALWTLHASEQLDEGTLDMMAVDKEPVIRAWAGRLTGERQIILPITMARLQFLAADPQASVRLAAVVAARQFVSRALTVDQPGVASPEEFDNLGGVIIAAIQASADAKDPLIPFMIWMAAEPMVAQDAQPALSWMLENGAATMPLSGKLLAKVMRRLCDTGEAAKLNPVVDFLAAAAERAPQLALAALDGLLEGQKARPLLPAGSTTALFEKLNANPDAKLRERSQQLAALWGDAAAMGRIFTLVQDSNAKLDDRLKAVQTLGQLKSDAARDGLLKFLPAAKPEPLLIETIRALGQIGGDDTGDQLIAGWKTFSPAVRREVVDVLVSRRRWAASLFTAVESKTISPTELSATAIRALVESSDEAIRRRAAQSIGRIRAANADKQAVIAAKKKMIATEGQPDLQAGHELAKKTCLVCHKFYGEGAEVGPDLTGVGRSTLDALLANVIDPNQVVGKGYESVDIETKDGREVSGRLVEDTPSHVKLLASGPKEEIVAKDNIAKMRVSELSVMPEGLEQMPDADFRNLILYILNPPQAAQK